jgi:Rieske 2Fe-2S family protein
MATVIEHATYTTSFPREYYHSPEIFEREIERIFHRQWLYFGHLSQLPEPGDYLARELVGEGVVVTRTTDDEVRAFLNVCRHRGMRLCPAGAGHKKRFICPYHQWSYATDGRLLNAPTIPDGERIEYEDWGLHPVQVEVWHGFIFVCLGLEPLEPLGSLFAACERGFARAQTEHLKQVSSISYDIASNWKVVMEGFFECYHCPAGHPELMPIVDVLGGEADEDDSGVVPSQYSDAHCTFRPGAQSLSRDGKFVCQKLLGEFDHDTGSAAGFNIGAYIKPAGLQLDLYADYASALVYYPISIDRTQMVHQWFVHEDAEEGVDYDVAAVTEMGDLINRQDEELCEVVQAGITSRRYVPGPLSIKREPGLLSALTTYFDLMDQAD